MSFVKHKHGTAGWQPHQGGLEQHSAHPQKPDNTQNSHGNTSLSGSTADQPALLSSVTVSGAEADSRNDDDYEYPCHLCGKPRCEMGYGSAGSEDEQLPEEEESRPFVPHCNNEHVRRLMKQRKLTPEEVHTFEVRRVVTAAEIRAIGEGNCSPCSPFCPVTPLDSEKESENLSLLGDGDLSGWGTERTPDDQLKVVASEAIVAQVVTVSQQRWRRRRKHNWDIIDSWLFALLVQCYPPYSYMAWV